MNQKQAIINYLREQTYTAINDLLTTSLTNEEILQGVGYLRVTEEVKLIPGDILVTLNNHPQRIHVFEIDTLITMITNKTVELIGVNRPLREEYYKVLYDLLYHTTDSHSFIFYALMVLIADEELGYREKVYQKGIRDIYKLHLSGTGAFKLFTAELTILRMGITGSCPLLDDIYDILGVEPDTTDRTTVNKFYDRELYEELTNSIVQLGK